MNPFCEIAIEEAFRLKEKNATESFSIGPKAFQETLRTALAMGADKGIHIETNLRPDQELQPLAIAKAPQFIAKRESVGVVVHLHRKWISKSMNLLFKRLDFLLKLRIH